MAIEMETLLRTRTDEYSVLTDTSGGALITAETRDTFTTESDATAAAQELLAQMLDLGYRLCGGLVGAERPAVSAGGQWRGELVEVLLASKPA
jgi:hypothetical protein